MVRVDRGGTQLVVLQLAFLNKLLIADVLEVDADKLLGKLFRDGTSEMAHQRWHFKALLLKLVRGA